MHNNLNDIRQDIFDIETVPKVLYVYRGDTFEVVLDLTMSASELNIVVLNCDGLPEALPLTLLESTDTSSKWNLVLTKELTLILTPKNHNFTIMIVKTDGTELILYKGIMNVNNRVYSNYSNNYYVAALLKQTAPTIADNDYLIGTMWVNVLTNRVYFLTSVVNDEANWLGYSDDKISGEITAEKVKQLYEANPDTNAFTDAEKAKLSGIEEGAEVNTVRPEDLDANNIRFNGSGTNYLVGETDVEGSIRELDTRVNILETSEVDLNAMAYFNYAGSIYGDKYSLLASAWEHSLTVDPLEISTPGLEGSGTAQYPNGETEGVIIPHGVTVIGDRAFRDWFSNNQPLVIPNSVTSIGTRAFYQWRSNNQLLVIPSSVTVIGDRAFYDWRSNNQPLVIPSGVTRINLFAFAYWTSNNRLLVIQNSAIDIAESAFRDWTSNNQPLVIPSGVTKIGFSAFRNWELVPYIEMQRITPPTLADANAFGGQNDAPIYVPDESVEAYKTATNWVNLAHRIFSINDKYGGLE